MDQLKINEKIYDVAIIGGGIAGCSAAIYASRFDLSTAIFAEMPGGTITQTHLVENYPGFVSISGPDLGTKFVEHAVSFGAELFTKKVIEVKKEGNLFLLTTRKEIFRSKTIIIATGTDHRTLNVSGEKEFANRGVSYCATCDGALFRNKVVCVVGAGDSAAKEALFLSQYCPHVYVFCRKDGLHPEPINARRVESSKNIEIIPNSEISSIFGDENGVKGIKLKNGKEFALEGVFVEVGRIPRTEAFQNLSLATDKEGRILIDMLSKTNVNGVFAAGDITAWQEYAKWDQAIVGAGEAVKAAYAAYLYLAENLA
ncbi:MAG: FAD-dependent oxidoreductase [Candidatus Woesearchaeota archaeon]|jgi:thioredoxin reductase (NADPH)